MLTYVLAHNHQSVNFSKSLAHNANLLGGNVVDVHEDALGEFVASGLNVGPHLVFSGLFVCDFWHLTMEMLLL